MIVIAHRGALHEATENSFLAFDKAIEAGATRIELDVQLTRDDHLVIMHDYTLQRTAGQKIRVKSADRREIESVKLLDGQPIPFLEQVVERYLPQVELNIELKDHGTRASKLIYGMLKRHPHCEKVILSSFHFEPLYYFTEARSNLKLACLLGPGLHWPRFMHQAPLIFMQEVNATIVHPWTRYVDENFMDQSLARGWKVFPYCERVGEEDKNKEALWTSLYSLGIHGLCTNYPRELRLWLDQIPQAAGAA